MKKVEVEIYTEFNHDYGLPEYARFGDAGMDIRSNITTTIEPMETKVIPTGMFVAIPYGYELQVRPRSGLSLKTEFRIKNSPGTVDHGFRGELCVIAHNLSPDLLFNIELGDRIAQIVLNEVPQIEWYPVNHRDHLPLSERGEGGFGHTGAN